MNTGCWFCGTEMIWGGDHSFEDYGLDGEGIVSNLSCPKCSAMALFYSGDKEDDGNISQETNRQITC